jgi:recombinational DNA repair protein RecR
MPECAVAFSSESTLNVCETKTGDALIIMIVEMEKDKAVYVVKYYLLMLLLMLAQRNE